MAMLVTIFMLVCIISEADKQDVDYIINKKQTQTAANDILDYRLQFKWQLDKSTNIMKNV